MPCSRGPLASAALALTLKLRIARDLITNGATGTPSADLGIHGYPPISKQLLVLFLVRLDVPFLDQ